MMVNVGAVNIPYMDPIGSQHINTWGVIWPNNPWNPQSVNPLGAIGQKTPSSDDDFMLKGGAFEIKSGCVETYLLLLKDTTVSQDEARRQHRCVLRCLEIGGGGGKEHNLGVPLEVRIKG